MILVGRPGDNYFEHHETLLDIDLLTLLETTVKEDAVLLDVGANIGLTTCAMSILAPKGTVHSFEPGLTTYSLLERTIAVNRLENVRAHNLGLSGDTVTALLTASKDNSSGAFVNAGIADENDADHTTETIQLTPLDGAFPTMGIEACDLVKVDIEGHEPQFLRGAERFIKTFTPEAIIEANHWCLNIFSRISLPEFVDLVHEHFPHVFAIDPAGYLDLGETQETYKFYFKNTTQNSFGNLYCGFDRDKMLSTLSSTYASVKTIKATEPRTDRNRWRGLLRRNRDR